MATSKKETKGSAGVKVAQEINKHAISTPFPKAALIEAIGHLADSKAQEGAAQGEAVSASLEITRISADYGVTAHAECSNDTSTVLGAWRDNVRAMALELAVAGSPFAETATNKAGETIGKLTGTGNNVLSIAKGVVDFGIDVDSCLNDNGEVSYRSVRKTVEAMRAERRAEKDPSAALLAAAKANAREAAKELLACVLGTDDVGLIESLAETLQLMKIEQESAVKAAAEIEAEADASTEAKAA